MSASSGSLQQTLDLLSGYGLTTAEILYRMPDHPRIIQAYIWQDYDVTPTFPALNRFLTFWREKLDGALFSVRVDHSKLISRAELRVVGTEFRLN